MAGKNQRGINLTPVNTKKVRAYLDVQRQAGLDVNLNDAVNELVSLGLSYEPSELIREKARQGFKLARNYGYKRLRELLIGLALETEAIAAAQDLSQEKEFHIKDPNSDFDSLFKQSPQPIDPMELSDAERRSLEYAEAVVGGSDKRNH